MTITPAPAVPAAVPPARVDLDALDEGIIGLLRGDGRMPYRAIARELAVTESTVRARVRRLEESGTMRVVAVTDIEAAGYSLLLAIGIQVEDRSPEAVARELARLPEVFSVNVVVGAQDIEVLVVSVKGESVRVGVKAPRHVQIHRHEIYELIQGENIAASRPARSNSKRTSAGCVVQLVTVSAPIVTSSRPSVPRTTMAR